MVVLEDLVKNLPYGPEFTFVNRIKQVSLDHIVGEFRFRGSLSFYQHHFKDHPVTPGVILTECCAQVGLVCFGSYLLREDDPEGSGDAENATIKKQSSIAFTSSSMEFLEAVYPEEVVTVTAKKIYFRFNKLKVRVVMTNSVGKKVCSGTLAGMLT
ncbi:beta-hydroxyacyl-ACP dehydratase [Gangjinia marincola]|uniref:Beta-hydroxyacyl-ACP dehydratase n=1 Tax=Gangjinia marincola TaxID=578463 RepID=A0ABP3XQT7_9FLAO